MQKSTKYKLNIIIGAVIALIYVLIPIDRVLPVVRAVIPREGAEECVVV